MEVMVFVLSFLLPAFLARFDGYVATGSRLACNAGECLFPCLKDETDWNLRNCYLRMVISSLLTGYALQHSVAQTHEIIKGICCTDISNSFIPWNMFSASDDIYSEGIIDSLTWLPCMSKVMITCCDLSCSSMKATTGEGAGHNQCSCGEHCGCNPCTCPRSVVTTVVGKAYCKCGADCACPTCSS
ncbi:hypothetical protein D5086_009406 [Populus alba]|uniref:Uncharacterized protein n=1 Tax=Populus alba TaxID=43335 RepID=A0ACC4CIJ0_POPAL